MTSSSSAADDNAPCCPPGSWGPVIEAATDDDAAKGQSTAGTVESIATANKDASIKVYVVGPKSISASPSSATTTKKALIVLGDVNGWTVRMKLMCDRLSTSLAAMVIYVDWGRGQTKSTNPFGDDFVAWLNSFPFVERVKPDVEACIGYAKEKLGADVTIDGLGFCWGGWAFMKCVEHNLNISRIAIGHPSFVIETKVFGGDEVRVMSQQQEGVCVASRAKWLLLPAGNDADHTKPNGAIADAVVKHGGKVKLYENMIHGWIPKGDPTDTDVRMAVEDALSEIEAFLSY